MKLQRGTIYMAPIEGPVMGCVPERMWWKPWRWKVTPVHWSTTPDLTPGKSIGTYEGEPITDLTLEGAIAMMKLFGVKHVDFEGE